jgi:protein-S-isoprenylcysteine O-methyltransferase Ste14
MNLKSWSPFPSILIITIIIIIIINCYVVYNAHACHGKRDTPSIQQPTDARNIDKQL